MLAKKERPPPSAGRRASSRSSGKTFTQAEAKKLIDNFASTMHQTLLGMGESITKEDLVTTGNATMKSVTEGFNSLVNSMEESSSGSRGAGHSQSHYDDIMKFFLHRQGIDKVADRECSSDSVTTLTNVDLVQPKPKEYNDEYQQQNLNGGVVKDFAELREAANLAKNVFVNTLTVLAKETNIPFLVSPDAHAMEVGISVAPLKSEQRAIAKAASDYADRKAGPPCSWLFDMVRGQVICRSEKDIMAVIDKLGQQNSLQVIRRKNRFATPTPSGFRDLMLNLVVEVPAGKNVFKHVCELQVHNYAIKAYDKEHGSHAVYEKFRAYFPGGDTAAVKRRLRMMANIESLAKVKTVQHWLSLKEMVNNALKVAEPMALESLVELLGTLSELDLKGQVQARLLQISSGTKTVAHARTLLDNAITFREQGNYKEALEMMHQCVALQIELLGSDHADVGRTYHSMGNVYVRTGQYDEALKSFEDALNCYKKSIGMEHSDVARTYNSMGEALEKQAKRDPVKLEEAYTIFEKALKINIAALGAEHEDVASTYHNMGTIKDLQGKYDEALVIYNSCLVVRKKELGGMHPKVAETYNNMGLVLKRQNKLSESLESFKQSLVIKVKTMGANHPDNAGTYLNMGMVLKKMDRLDDALKMFQKSCAIKIAAKGPDDPSVASMYSNMAMIMKNPKVDRKPEALAMLEKAFVIVNRHFPAKHQIVVATGAEVNRLKAELQKAPQ